MPCYSGERTSGGLHCNAVKHIWAHQYRTPQVSDQPMAAGETLYRIGVLSEWANAHFNIEQACYTARLTDSYHWDTQYRVSLLSQWADMHSNTEAPHSDNGPMVISI